MSTTFNCDTCYDTRTIDQGGREVRCPDCTPARFDPQAGDEVRLVKGRYSGYRAIVVRRTRKQLEVKVMQYYGYNGGGDTVIDWVIVNLTSARASS